ncbi:MAG TPA: TRAP transporter large permease subunit [Polyangiales bacterium]|nr:TRAP transporter large permease subunit [Polyangiales bacterium]
MILIALAIILLAFLGVPLFALFGAAALALFLSLPEGNWASPAIDMFGIQFAEQPSLITIPLFTFAGYLLAESGMPRRLVELSRAWLGWMPGSLAVVCLIASAFFTTFTGGSGITIVAVGGLLLPVMLQEKYPEKFTLGLVTTGGSLGILFPPSVPLIMYGIIANLSMDKLLVAGIIPGILVVAVLGVYGASVGIKTGFKPVKFEWGNALSTLWAIKWEVPSIPVVLLGGFGTGVLRLHEAAVLTALYVLFIEVVIYRDINIRKDLPRVVIESMTLVGAILTIMACAVGFTGFLIQAQVPMKLLEMMQSVISSQFIFLLVLNIFLIIVGMLMEIFAAIVVAVPLVIPLARAYGLDPYHFAIIFLLNLEIAYLMPPLGINLFISSIRFGRPVTSLYGSVWTFIAVLFATLMVVSYVPILTTWLPSKVQSDEMIGEPASGDPGETMGGDDLKDEDFGLSGDDLEKLKDGGTADGGAADGGSAAAPIDGGTAAAEPPKEEPAKPLTKAEKAKAKREAAKAEREAKKAARKAKAAAPAE